VNQHTDLRLSLGAVLDAAIRLLHADEGSVMLLDELGVELRIAEARGLPEDLVESFRLPVGQGIAGAVAQSGHALLLPSIVDVRRFVNFVGKTRQIYSAISVPLRARSRTIGVLNLNVMGRDRHFEQDDLRVASLLAEHAAVAISNAELMGRTERTAAELESVRGASVRLARSLDVEAVASSALTEAMSLAGTGSGFLCLAGGDERPLELARYRGLSPDALRQVLEAPGFRTVLRSAEPRRVTRAGLDPVFAPLAREIGSADLALLPLPTPAGRPGGLLVLALPESRDPISLRPLAAFAVEAGLAIANATLYREVRRKEEEMEAIVFSIALPMVLVDERGCFLTINPAAAETFRLSPEFEIGQPARGKLGDSLERMLLDDEGDTAREVVLDDGGQARMWRAAASSVGLGRSPGGRILVLDDVTAERELEQQKADFLAVIGHELRTPLTVIKGFASTLVNRGDVLDTETRTDAVRTIFVQSERLERLIGDLLYVGRIETSRAPLHLAWDDVVAVCDSVVEEFRRRAADQTISLEHAAAQIPLQMDRVKLEQVLYHLLDNAVKYSERGAPVRVIVEEEAEAVRVTVEDKGVGMFSGDIPRLFRPFGQLDSTSTRRHGGTGIGLFICKTLTDAFGGRIWAESLIGKGSRFHFTVPRTPPHVSP
jgi:signal transduction histidine kinase